MTVQAQILALLRELRDETGCTFVLRHPRPRRRVADRRPHRGAVRRVASPSSGIGDDVLERPAHPYTVGLLRVAAHAARRPRAAAADAAGRTARSARPTRPAARSRRGARCTTTRATSAAPDAAARRHARRHRRVHPARRAAPRRDDRRRAASGRASGPTLADYGSPSRSALVVTGATKSFALHGGLPHARPAAGAARRRPRGRAGASRSRSSARAAAASRRCCARSPGCTSHDDGDDRARRSGTRPQMVFQDAGASLTPWMTDRRARRRAAARPRASRRDRAASASRDALALVGLPDRGRDGASPRQLSGGQRQRAALARGDRRAARGAAVRRADERARRVARGARCSTCSAGSGASSAWRCCSSPTTSPAARVVADRIAVMYLGRIVEVGPADEVTSAPRASVHPKALLAAVPGRDRIARSASRASPRARSTRRRLLVPPALPGRGRRLRGDDVPVSVRLGGDGRTIACLRVHDGDARIAIDLAPEPRPRAIGLMAVAEPFTVALARNCAAPRPAGSSRHRGRRVGSARPRRDRLGLVAGHRRARSSAPWLAPHSRAGVPSAQPFLPPGTTAASCSAPTTSAATSSRRVLYGMQSTLVLGARSSSRPAC